MKPNMLLAKNKMKKNTPRAKLIFAIVNHLPFSAMNFLSANFPKPMMTKSPGMKKDSPLPAKVAIIPKILPIGRPRVAT